MKAIKVLSVAFAMAFAMNANAQFVKSGGASGGDSSEEYAYYEGYGKDKCMTNELSFQFGDGWGIGYQLRREINPYFAINIIGIHYQTSWENPDKGGNINFRFLGARGYSPSWKWIRGYADLNMGYTLGVYDYDGVTDSHHFGLDFGVGVQLHKKIAVGYSMTYLTGYNGGDGGAAHYFKLSFPF